MQLPTTTMHQYEYHSKDLILVCLLNLLTSCLFFFFPIVEDVMPKISLQIPSKLW